MLFLNQYTDNNPQYNHSVYTADAIYAVGQAAGKASISKIDHGGELLWEKNYTITGQNNLIFHEVVSCGASDILVLGRSNQYTVLMRVNPQGVVVWCKNYPVPFVNTVYFKVHLEKVTSADYVLAIWIDSDIHLFKVNDAGNIQLQKRVNAPHVSQQGMTNNGSRIMFHGGGGFLELDLNFNILNSFSFDLQQSRSNHVVLYSGNMIYTIAAGGTFGTPGYHYFLARFPFSNQPMNLQIQTRMFLGGAYSVHMFIDSQANIFMETGLGSDKHITRIDQQLNTLWTKRFTGITDIRIFSADNDNIYLYRPDGVVGHLGGQANSCISSTVTAHNFSNGQVQLFDNPIAVVSSLSITAVNKSVQVTTLSSAKDVICVIDEPKIEIGIYNNTLLQSPNFYLQAAGSTGDDSTKGNHIRWTFAGILGDQHLPKGDYAATSHNFNKPSDFVKVYRARYEKALFTLDFSVSPQTVNDQLRYWLYKFNGDSRIFFVHFRNSQKYDQVRGAIDPMSNSLAFIESYGNEVIEVENKRELFFEANLAVAETSSGSLLRLESLSVPENKVFVPKSLSFRGTFEAPSESEPSVICENGRSLRFRSQACYVKRITFGFYSDFIVNANSLGSWEEMGEFALTLDQAPAYERLDPDGSNPVHGKWLRYNDNAFVDIRNYRAKWDGPVESWNRNIKDIVSKYIELSNSVQNPRALEYVNLNLAYDENNFLTVEQEPMEGAAEVSNLDMLRIASYDYHIARMLGLGKLDTDNAVFDAEYIYLGEYYTLGDLGEGPGEVHHLSMSLPTSGQTQRLPLAVDLKELVSGLTEDEDGENQLLPGGYTQDGKKRYVRIFSEPVYQGEENPIFFSNAEPVDTSSFTIPIYAGLEYRLMRPGENDPGIWAKPELSHDVRYLNIDATNNESFETVSLLIPDYTNSLYTHRQTLSGRYYYAGYGINWFSRATESPVELSIDTTIKPANLLLPPANINALLIQRESPLMFTSADEQGRLSGIPELQDKTLIRLLFDYNSDHELVSYQIPLDSPVSDSIYETDTESLFPDDDEVFGDEIEIYFRNQTPRNISGQITGIVDHSNPLLSIIQTQDYLQASTGVTLSSDFPTGTSAQNFLGALFITGTQQYVIQGIQPTSGGLTFTVYKKQLSDGIITGEIPTLSTQNLQPPFIEEDGLFTVSENMQSSQNWGIVDSLTVQIGQNWPCHREVVRLQNDNSQIVRYVEKTRGIWHHAKVEKFLENFTFESTSGQLINKIATHRGIYKLTFNNYQLSQNTPYSGNSVSVEWFNGIVRLFTLTNSNGGTVIGSRKKFKVFRTENIGTSGNLTLYIKDDDFQSDDNGNPNPANDDIIIGNNVFVNYYPSYRAYLYYNQADNLTEQAILPGEGENVHYSVFALRTVDKNYSNNDMSFYRSRYSVPAMIFAQKVITPMQPEAPLGALYATRPDTFGKSTYTITTQFRQKPYSISFHRADDQALLSAVYSTSTIAVIRQELAQLGGNQEQYLTNRWKNFLDFDTLINKTSYNAYPPIGGEETPYNFPLPDRFDFFQGINNFIIEHNLFYGDNVDIIEPESFGTIALNETIIPEVTGRNDELRLLDFVIEVVKTAFIPLTEVPVIYDYIRGSSYTPVDKKQVIRDKDGYLLDPNVPGNGFDMAPMMKVIGTNKVQFTDFTLDGTTSNLYFYAAKEIGSQMKMGQMSVALGPIKMVNTNAPEAPKILHSIPVFRNGSVGLVPYITFEIAAYSPVQEIKKINIYRTFDRLNAEALGLMDLVMVIDLGAEGIDVNSLWRFNDHLQDLDEIPYSKPIFYRITVSRRVEYADINNNIIVEYAPSLPSKILATLISEVDNPEAPSLDYFSEPLNGTELREVILHWEKTCYNGKYHLYKMNSQGNWVKIHFLQTNNQHIYLPLELTELGSGTLNILNSDGNAVYHHFKVVAENTAGMFSTEERILTIYNPETWQDIGGIGTMIIEGTFLVR